MPISTLLDYEAFIEEKLNRSLQRIGPLLSHTLDIPKSVIINSSSLIELSKNYTIPRELLHNEIIGLIPFLILEYTDSHILSQPTKKSRGFWEYSTLQKRHIQFADEITALCDRSRMSSGINLNQQVYLELIKVSLSKFALENKSPTQYAFLNLLQAFINKTSGVEGWAFSPEITLAIKELSLAYQGEILEEIRLNITTF
jgi:hypothetical protein